MENQPVFLIWSMSRFDEHYSSAIFSLAKELANTHQIIYVDYPFTWKDRFSAAQKNRIEERNKLLQKNENRLIHMPELGKRFYTFLPKYVWPINWLPKGKIYHFFSQINNHLFLKAQKKAIKELNPKKLILINSFSPLYGLSFEQYFRQTKPYTNVAIGLPVRPIFQSTERNWKNNGSENRIFAWEQVLKLPAI